mgnify:CR=1 FL=1
MELMDQRRSQDDLIGRFDPHPRAAHQFDNQNVRGGRSGQFHLHEAWDGSGLAAALTPAAEGGVIKLMFAGEGGGCKTAAIKCRQKLSALTGVAAPGT